MNWSEYPLLRPVFLFIIGIIIAYSLPIPRMYIFLFLFAQFILYIALHFTVTPLIELNTFRSILIYNMLLGTGALITENNKIKYDEFHYAHKLSHDKPDTFYIILHEEVKIKNSVKTTGEIVRINGNATRGKILVYFQLDSLSQSYVPGDLIVAFSKIEPTRENTNPEAFDYKNHLAFHQIFYQTYIAEGNHLIVKHDQLGSINTIIYKIRSWAKSQLRNALQNDDHFAIASAMILGIRNYLSEELYTTYSETGAVHVLAVSGLHVGIVCGIFIWLFSRIKSKNTYIIVLKLVVLLTIVWAYTLITGAAPAVTRAALMFSLFLIGKYFFENYNIYNILAASALILLLYNPFLLFQASFQFSYLALISIVFFHRRIYATLVVESKWMNKIINLGVVSIAAQILVFPLTIYYFHKFPIYFILSGIISVGLAGIILTLGLLTILFSSLPVIYSMFSILLENLLSLFLFTIKWIHQLPFSVVEGLWLSTTSMIGIYLIICILMYMMAYRRYVKSLMAILAILIILIGESIYIRYKNHNTYKLTIYDTYGTGLMIDVFKNGRGFSYASEDQTERDVQFVAGNHRLKYGIHQIDSLKHTNGIFEINGKWIYMPLLNELNIILPVSSNVLIVTNNTILPHQVLTHHMSQEVVITQNLTNKMRELWIDFCSRNKINYFDMRTSGAYIRIL